MTILILTLGSRGDVQPYVALGQGLQAAGHDVTLCTSVRFEPFIRKHGLDYAYMNDGFMELMDTDLSREAMEQMTGILDFLRYGVRLWSETTGLQREVVRDGWNAVQEVEPDLILYHPKVYAAPHYAERVGVPVVMPFLIPANVPTGDFPSVGFPVLSGLPEPVERVYNRLTFRLTRWLAETATRGFVRDWRTSVGLPEKAAHTGMYRTHTGAPVPIVFGFSRHLVPRPPDWPEHVHISGSWFLDGEDGWTPSDELTGFLDAGPPPVYVGFGSMSGQAPGQLVDTVVEALRRTGRRGLLATGWGGLRPGDLPESVHVVDEVPHDWLFPRMAAVVHHGGAGTTAAGLRAGRPSVICPFSMDQPFWGRRVHEAGAGPQPVFQKHLTAPALAAAIQEATERTSIQRAAEALGRRIRSENGVQRGVDLIERAADRRS